MDAGELPVERGRWRTVDDELRGGAIRMLMCLFRLDVPKLAARYGDAAWALFGSVLPNLKPLEADGLIRLRTDGLDVTDLGRLFIRNVAMEFDAYLERESGAPAFSQTV